MNATLQHAQLEEFLRKERFTAADRAFVSFLQETYAESDANVLAAAALCVSATREGHSFYDLSQPPIDDTKQSEQDNLEWPTLAEWEKAFAQSASTGGPSQERPLVFTPPNALYLNKYFEYEKRLAQSVIRMTQRNAPRGATQANSNSSDLQAVAVERALESSFYLISGGPGTGKTTTILHYLVNAIQSAPQNPKPKIIAVAPTGKAAARLSDSIASGLDRLDVDTATKEFIQNIPCMTVHRALGAIPNRITFHRNEESPLEHDIVIVDESSMIDLPLMQKLFCALRSEATIVLLGDHDQLSSVEVGSVFSDLIQSSLDRESPIFGHSTNLLKTYRFSEDSSIHTLCQLCKKGETSEFTQFIQKPKEDFQFHPLKSGTRNELDPIVNLIVDAHEKRAACPDVETAFSTLGEFVALTPFNAGPFGTRSLNQLVDSRIRRSRPIDASEPYPGMPLIILENNYDLELYNGDIGIVWSDAESKELFAWFGDGGNPLKRVNLQWLPKRDLAYCLTIHKSQGSEFDHVVGIFPAQDDSFVSRELVYTCCSRAKEHITIFGSETALAASIDRSQKRATRLDAQILELSAES